MKTVRRMMTVLVCGILIAGWLAIAFVALPSFPIILLFGRDNPNTSILVYLFYVSLPLVAIILMSIACCAAYFMWISQRWKVAGFALACSLGVLGWWTATHFRLL